VEGTGAWPRFDWSRGRGWEEESKRTNWNTGYVFIVPWVTRMCHVFVQMSTTVFLSLHCSCLEDVPNKVRVIGIRDCLDSAGVDISKDDCSSRDNVRLVHRGHPCCIYCKAVVP